MDAIVIIFIRMKKILATISDEAYAVLKKYKEDGGVANLDTALDELLKERGRERAKGK